MYHVKIQLISAGQLLQTTSPPKIQNSVYTPEHTTDSPDTLKEIIIQISEGAMSSKLYSYIYETYEVLRYG